MDNHHKKALPAHKMYSCYLRSPSTKVHSDSTNIINNNRAWACLCPLPAGSAVVARAPVPHKRTCHRSTPRQGSANQLIVNLHLVPTQGVCTSQKLLYTSQKPCCPTVTSSRTTSAWRTIGSAAACPWSAGAYACCAHDRARKPCGQRHAPRHARSAVLGTAGGASASMTCTLEQLCTQPTQSRQKQHRPANTGGTAEPRMTQTGETSKLARSLRRQSQASTGGIAAPTWVGWLRRPRRGGSSSRRPLQSRSVSKQAATSGQAKQTSVRAVELAGSVGHKLHRMLCKVTSLAFKAAGWPLPPKCRAV